tara:strand:- start:426 stop:560 length:135 start_codon:yes stop_codon:yes gene_type:complete
MVSDKLNKVALWLGKIGMYVTWASNSINNLRDMETKQNTVSDSK